jgi:hypothetical protein
VRYEQGEELQWLKLRCDMICLQEIKKCRFYTRGHKHGYRTNIFATKLAPTGGFYFSSAKFYEDGINLPIAIGIGMLKHYSGN